MTFAYSASFNVADITNLFSTITMTTAGKSAIVVTVANLRDAVVSTTNVAVTSVFNHAQSVGIGVAIGEDRSSDYGQSLHQDSAYGAYPFNLVLQKALRDAASAASGGAWVGAQSNILVTFSNATLKYTISYSATIGITWGSDQTARLLGFLPTPLSGATSYTSPMLAPHFVIRPTLLGVCDPSPNYEPEGIASQAVSASGLVFGLARSVSPIYRDWIQQYEPPEKAERLRALTTSHPYTHQALFENCRTGLPFVVIDGGFGNTFAEAFFLRADGCMWKPERASPGNGSQFHIKYQTVVAGTVP